ncbi:glycosyltransferase family 4 protein [Desulfohalobium retbaense]|uniref:Glycosyl transferase group 1 n=1 Tax=Desulfohalobium retbaense (strain ATCC 49708 / DSM 5692 / JCM 16813 / HR100) TaxID=485915 RepID=C8X056_DESRD|nr:glycosyltransferase family 4 protein [Desulfohalobium retbaense]ACV67681.1 glycosyl transferase group 1 [Desulfohalobium retbaense DSM 5692]
MKVIVSVNGRFHAFDLAIQLHRHNVLHSLITSYPKFKVLEWNIKKSQIKSLIFTEIFKRSIQRLPNLCSNLPTIAQKFIFDKRTASNIPSDADIFVGWSSNSLHSIRKAKQMGLVTILERGSAHMLTQQKLLTDEYEKYGLKPKIAPDKIVEKELKEYEEADYISIPSSFVSQSFVEHGINKNKLIQVPYGVDLTHFKQIEKEDSIFRVIYAGRLSLQKGSHYLLQAIYELDLPNFEFWHLGSMAQEIEPFLKKYDSKKIFLKGHKPQNELYKYYSQGNVFCFPSIHDGFGMVIIQAMACALPVIGSEKTGTSDIVEDNKDGFVIPIRDVEAIKEKILYLYENQDICYQMGQAAKEKVSSGFTWDDYGRKMIGQYQRILDARGQNQAHIHS